MIKGETSVDLPKKIPKSAKGNVSQPTYDDNHLRVKDDVNGR